MARSCALVPVVVPCRQSIETVNAASCPPVVSVTICGMPSSSRRHAAHGRHTMPRPWVTMKLTASGVARLGRHDEVALVLAVGVVDDQDDLAGPDVVDGLLDRREHRRLSSASLLVGSSTLGHAVAPSSSRSTYFAITSTSRFTGSPGVPYQAWSRPGCAGSGRRSTPSGCRVGDGEAHAVDGDRPLLHHVADQVVGDADRIDGRRRPHRAPRSCTSPTPSTCPCTRWPPRRAARVTGRSRFTGCPRRGGAGSCDRSVSSDRSNARDAPSLRRRR